MSNFTPPLTFEDKIRAATKAQIPHPSQAFQARLGEQLFNQPISNLRWYERFKVKSISPIKKIALVVFVLTLITVSIVGPQKVFAAIQNLLRYIPGIGFVETDRVLTTPVTIEREGISLTVQSIVVTEEETVLVYYAQNLPIGELGEYCETHRTADPSFECLLFEPSYQLRTGDGTIYAGHPTGGYTTDKRDGTDWTGRVIFPSLPPDISQVDFLLDVLPNMHPDMAPEDWVVPLRLTAAGEGDQLPAVFQPEYATLTPEAAGQLQDAVSPETDSTPALRDGVQLLLNAASIQENTLTLSINVLWENENWYAVEIMDFTFPGTVPIGAPMPHYVTLIDANEKQIPLVFNTMESPYTEVSGKKATFIFSGDITGQELAPPLTLTLNNINVDGGYVSKEDQPSFLFTPATDLQPGECEEISQSVVIFDNLLEFIKVCSVEKPGEVNLGGGGGDGVPGTTSPPPPQYGLELHMVLPSTVRNAFIGDKDCQREVDRQQENCGGSYSKPSEQDIAIDGQLYYYHMPTWPVEYAVTGVEFILPGPWSIQFDLSELTQSSSATQAAGVPIGSKAAHLVEETIPDGTVLAAGQEFVKTFTLENIGETTWNEEYQIVFYASPQGETLASPQSIPLGKVVSPGDEVVISIPLATPQSAGTYTVVWQLVNPNGGVIDVDGGNIWINIRVGGGG
jgi:hypothetical protein